MGVGWDWNRDNFSIATPDMILESPEKLKKKISFNDNVMLVSGVRLQVLFHFRLNKIPNIVPYAIK